MEINFKEIAGAFVVLFAILDIIGAIPIIINLQRKTGKVPALKVSTISWALLVIIYFLGDGVLALFGVDVESFAVAGSIVVLAIGFEMIFDITIFRHDSTPKCFIHRAAGLPADSGSRLIHHTAFSEGRV